MSQFIATDSLHTSYQDDHQLEPQMTLS